MVVYDDLEPHEKLKVYDNSVNAIRMTDTFGEFQFAYHYGSVVSPYVRFEEPLRVECLHLLECVRERTRPLTDGRNGLEVVQIIEAAQTSLAVGGVEISAPGRDIADIDGVIALPGVGTDGPGELLVDVTDEAISDGREAVEA
jgi:predicted dehydrogenase